MNRGHLATLGKPEELKAAVGGDIITSIPAIRTASRN